MGSLETGLPLKRDHHLLRSSSLRNSNNGILGQRSRSRFARLVLSKRIDYLQLICAVAVFFFFVFLFQIFFLPGSVMEYGSKSEKAHDLFRKNGEANSGELAFLKELDFGEDINFEPLKLMDKFQKDANLMNGIVGSKRVVRFGYRKPKLALVFADLWVDQHQILMATVSTALLEIGYEIEVFSLENGPANDVWRKIGVPVSVITADENMKFTVDWLNYDGILVNSLKAAGFLSCLMQEPFKNVPLVWTIHEQILAARLRQYVTSGQSEIVDTWKRVFSRATVVVFPNYILPMGYSACDPGNYFVIPGSPEEAWKADEKQMVPVDNSRLKMGYGQDDFVVAVVGSQLSYRGLWLEHAFILKALFPLHTDFGDSSSRLKIIILAGDSTSNYSSSVETIADKLGYRTGIVKHVAGDENTDTVISTADLVIYGSFLEEHSFPDTLLKAMCFEKPIIAPDLPTIRKYVGIGDTHPPNKANLKFLDKIEKQLNHTNGEYSTALTASNDTFVYTIWEDQKYTDMASMGKRREDEELKDRTDQPRGTWDEVYRNARRPDRSLHERDEGELERTGQPLCIYEPYFGVGTWPFLHHTSLYRGLGLSTKGRRPGADDVDAPSRLPLLNNGYFRDVLGEYGAFFAIANRIDRIHKNAWIGFQSWRATARMRSLSKTAEKSLLDSIEARRHGDTLYFWVRLDTDPRNPSKQDFWSFCDAINAGNCQLAFSEALKHMYGIKHNLTSLPLMPSDEGTWSVMHSWVLPTKSFMEFVMFSRMFVDALDAQFHDDHQKAGRCYLSLSKDKHCYSRLLELLVNVWAYHSARRIVYVDPETGFMQEQHRLKGRRGQMWIKWFQYSTLKSMDEDLAEEADSDQPRRRWLWPSTGEIFWQGKYVKPLADEANSTVPAAELLRVL
ncbi:UNVERIFIED_CONTAM: hypothetical protein Scaly_1791700 [Sesamum calycinum]|uniref:Glycosyl transferase family 1 domain-containing protein n=1 Tax=Sesamum calycinum TaxID=2727403 RepID=A0AAW2NXW6_9LAMI